MDPTDINDKYNEQLKVHESLELSLHNKENTV